MAFILEQNLSQGWGGGCPIATTNVQCEARSECHLSLNWLIIWIAGNNVSPGKVYLADNQPWLTINIRLVSVLRGSESSCGWLYPWCQGNSLYKFYFFLLGCRIAPYPPASIMVDAEHQTRSPERITPICGLIDRVYWNNYGDILDARRVFNQLLRRLGPISNSACELFNIAPTRLQVRLDLRRLWMILRLWFAANGLY